MSDTNELIEVWFDGYAKLTRGEIEDAGGDYGQAVQNLAGGSGVMVERAQDEHDGYCLEDRCGS